jgi:lambda repressor-like predicted transcriptional regulator
LHHADIKAALIKAGFNQSTIADDMKVSDTTVSYVIRGLSTSRRIANHISKKVGIPVQKLWPGRYETSHHKRKKAA